MKRTLFVFLVVLTLALSACNFPGTASAEEQAASVQTAAAETVNAQLTSNALLTPSPTATTQPTDTPEPSNTPEASDTPEPTTEPGSACDAMQFVSDVTVPDGTDFAAGETFTKTWRLRNIGTCTWTPDYDLVFESGDAMDGPASQALTGNVAPGQEVDISVLLTAPAAEGNYVGNWKLRNASGNIFGLPGPFFVEIDVVSGGGGDGDGDGENEITLSPSAKGFVRSDGNVSSNAYVGDNDSNQSLQAFFSFDLSSVPNGATIDSVRVNFSDYQLQGEPFNDLGCLRGYAVSVFPLDSGDYFSGTASGAILRWCNSGELDIAFLDDDVKGAIEAVLDTDVFELRVQFNQTSTDSDSLNDQVRFGTPSIVITYTEP